MSVFERRRRGLYEHLDRRGIDFFLVEDREDRRNPSLRYLSGHPNDALLFLDRRGKATLMAWDVPLAERLSSVDEILSYNDFGRTPLSGLLGFLEPKGLKNRSFTLDLDKRFPYPLVMRIRDELAKNYPGAEILCREDGPDSCIETLRMVKDEEEISPTKKAAEILNFLLAGIERGLREGTLFTETDLALFIERECRALGAEGTSFATIAAGPSRSFGIHAFPNYGPGIFAGPGLSILDFGVFFQGYAGDVTLTLVTGKPRPRQKLFVDLVEEAYHLALELCRPGESTLAIARRVEEFFRRRGLSMPHSLGHGLGLEVHEAPFLRTREDSDTELAPGMIFTLEPGLYDPAEGGVRLENDILITDSGHEVLTKSRILYKE